MKSVYTVVGDGAIGIKADSGVTIDSVKSVDPATLTGPGNEPADMPLGLIAFRLKVPEPGDTAQVTIFLSEAAPADARWVKYDAVNGWYPDHLTILSVFRQDRRAVTLLLEDGAYGDADGVRNGVIVDPGGIGVSEQVSTEQDGAVGTPVVGAGGSGGGGGGCLISASVSGSGVHPWGLLLLVFPFGVFWVWRRMGRGMCRK